MDLNINVPLAMNNKTNKAFLLHSTIYWSVCSVRKPQQTFRKPEKKKEKKTNKKVILFFVNLSFKFLLRTIWCLSGSITNSSDKIIYCMCIRAVCCFTEVKCVCPLNTPQPLKCPVSRILGDLLAEWQWNANLYNVTEMCLKCDSKGLILLPLVMP